MTGWWRSNALALGAIVVLVPVTALVIAGNEWGVMDANRGSRAVVLSPGSSAEYAGATIGPATAEFAELPLTPQGARVVSVRIAVHPGDPPITCSSPVLRERDGARRQWNATDDLGREWDPDVETFCSSEAAGPYELELDYLVPGDASGPFTVELGSPAGWPEFVSAVVAP